ncbi:MAG: acyltransferase domain-containing protein, partial [Candidatus Krumholzibacteria bacterium]|nr:acyltransferase domain-containing protein [Candidatus Krumholzibacteria bacterium]
MSKSAHRAVAIVGVGALMPDAPNARAFWQNIKDGRYSITDVHSDRWDADLYYDPDPKAPDKSYTKIGGWVRDWEWDPLKWKFPIPPRVSMSMDLTQKWAIVVTREALADYGYPNRALDPERTAVILGNAMGGDTHLMTATRILFPEYAGELIKAPTFAELPEKIRRTILKEMREGVGRHFPPITEDTMPGELSNIIAGRIAALFNFRGPNYVADAACASAMAAIGASIEGLEENEYDVVITGGIDANMSAQTFVKFCKIGALSATGTRPYAEGADGFVMGEGAAVFVIKRLEDAERDGDKIYAVIRALGGSSDGKGKGITAPNPVGQKLAVQRAWQAAGLEPCAGDMIEGHGTSTRVGDVVEVESLSEVFAGYQVPPGTVTLGSVKSNIGHLKGAAGAAGLLKVAFALDEKCLPPSLNFHKPNPGIDFEKSPFKVNTELKPWERNQEGVRRAGVSAFGFGGTNFHAVMEEYIPGRIEGERKAMIAVGETWERRVTDVSAKAPPRGALVLGSDSDDALRNRLRSTHNEAAAGRAPHAAPPLESDLRATVRIAIDYGDAAELAQKAEQALTALEQDQPGRWKALRAKGIFLGRGPAPKVAFLFTGQGSQYVNMLKTLRDTQPIIADTFREADRVMQPHLEKPLTDYIFVDDADEKAVAAAAHELKQTVITQPAVLAAETALARLLGAYGVSPDMVMGHSLGEYGALVAAGGLPFDDGLRAVSARGGEMTKASRDDNGLMAAVHGPLEEIEKTIAAIDGYVVVANINSTKEAVIGGATPAVQEAMTALREAGCSVTQLQVSHAFHTDIVGAAADALAKILRGMKLQPPTIPVVANISGRFYPMAPDVVPEMIDILARQVASPVQFVKGLNTLYDEGARVFVELGPKRALYGFAADVVGSRDGVTTLFTNHPRIGDLISFNHALCGVYAAGLGVGVKKNDASADVSEAVRIAREVADTVAAPVAGAAQADATLGTRRDVNRTAGTSASHAPPAREPGVALDRYVQLGHLFAEFLDRGFEVYKGSVPQQTSQMGVCITGASLGLPGVEHVFDDTNVERILRGDQFIDVIPMKVRRAMADKNITRLVKGKDGEANFETIDNLSEVIKLAARGVGLDLHEDFGFPEDRLSALDLSTRLAIGAGIDALRDAGIPLVMRYKTTTKGTTLPDRWMLPENMRDDTGVIFGSAFPGLDSFAEIISSYERDRSRREQLTVLDNLRARLVQLDHSSGGALEEIDRKIDEVRTQITKEPHQFNRRFLFRVLSMGHAQFAEHIGARGPNTQLNGACATGTQAVGVAQDWIRAGRCRRVIIVTADDVTSDNLLEWFGSGFLASGAAATDEIVEEAALPFDRRRHGLIIGMGGAAMVVESEEAARERGVQPICEVLNTVTANSAYHGSRLDVEHICNVMEKLIAQAERDWGINRHDIAPETVFVSHETYTPARGGSASAEVFALRRVFGPSADKIVMANTKGFTGHPMAVAIEDVVAVKTLETGIVPPVPNYKEVDPELGQLNLSKGGVYPVRYALRLGAGFGSQISMALSRWVPTADGRRRHPKELGYQYRIVDRQAWSEWLRSAGVDAPELEVVKRTLRIKDDGRAATRVRQTVSGERDAHAVTTVQTPVAGHQANTEAPPPAELRPEPTSGPTATAVSRSDPVEKKVLDIVSDKTGYPTDMLDLDLDLEADLGIDTVKQAETFAAIREAYGIPRDDELKLRDYPTLARAIQFVYDNRPDLQRPGEATPATAPESERRIAVPTPSAPSAGAQSAAATDTVNEVASPSAAPSTQPTATVVTADDEVQATVLNIVAEKTGYPTDMLDLDLDLEADLGIDTVKQAEMFAAIREAYDIPRDDTIKLRDYPTLAHAIQFVYDRRPDLAREATPPRRPAATKEPVEKVQTSPAATMDEPAPTPSLSNAGAPIEGGTEIPATPGVAANEEVLAIVLNIVAEKTGYPTDMLDLDLDLEADLGIDTVKQAEMFAAICEAYDIPWDDTIKLRDYPTLAHAIQFVYDRRPDLDAGQPVVVEAPQRPEAASPVASDGESDTRLVGSMQAANDIPRRAPVPHLRPDLELCKPTRVKLDSSSRVVVMTDTGGVGKSLVGRLKRLGADVLLIGDVPDAKQLSERIDDWKAGGPIQGVYWLAALDDEGPVSEMDLATWREAVRLRVKLLYTTMRALYDHIGKPDTFLLSATRLGGQHGYDEDGAVAPLGGAVAGFTKALKRERHDALIKVVDFEASRKTAAYADLLIDEALRDPGVVEVGYKDGYRWSIGLEERPLAGDESGIALNKDTVFVITGAAGSIVSAVTTDLAASSGGTFHLLDLAPIPDPEDPDIRGFATDKVNLKRAIFDRLKASGERATPAMVERELSNIERRHASLTAIQAIEAVGGTAYYYSVNLLDADAVDGVMREIADRSGRVDVLVHAAG